MSDLTEECITWLKANGASIVGVSNIDRFVGAPKGHHPRDFISRAQSVITFGVLIPYQVLHYDELLIDSEIVPSQSRLDILQNYYYRQAGYAVLNNLLNSLALRLCNILEEKGYRSIYFPATYGEQGLDFIKQKIPSMSDFFS